MLKTLSVKNNKLSKGIFLSNKMVQEMTVVLNETFISIRKKFVFSSGKEERFRSIA